jgi:hypothetical protein
LATGAARRPASSKCASAKASDASARRVASRSARRGPTAALSRATRSAGALPVLREPLDASPDSEERRGRRCLPAPFAAGLSAPLRPRRTARRAAIGTGPPSINSSVSWSTNGGKPRRVGGTTLGSGAGRGSGRWSVARSEEGLRSRPVPRRVSSRVRPVAGRPAWVLRAGVERSPALPPVGRPDRSPVPRSPLDLRSPSRTPDDDRRDRSPSPPRRGFPPRLLDPAWPARFGPEDRPEPAGRPELDERLAPFGRPDPRSPPAARGPDPDRRPVERSDGELRAERGEGTRGHTTGGGGDC